MSAKAKVIALPANTRAVGRPPRYSEEIVTDICYALAQGAPIGIACQYAGIGDSTYFDWCKRHPEFLEKTTRARAAQVVRNLSLIQQAAPDDWRAAVEMLRLTNPREFAKRLVADAAPGTNVKFTLDITGGNAEAD